MKAKKSELVFIVDGLKALSSFGATEVAGLGDYIFFVSDRVAAFGGGVAVSFPFKAGFEGAISLDEFSKFVRKVPAEDVEIAESENQVVISSGSSRAGFIMAESKFMESVPDLGVGNVKKWLKIPEDFSEALRYCQFSVSSDNSNGVVACAYVRPQSIVGTDNYRITEKFFGKKAPEGFTFFVPKKLCKPLSDMEFATAGVLDGWIHIQTKNGGVISLRNQIGEYPEYEHYFEAGEGGVEVNLPPELVPALDRTGIVDSGNNTALTISKGQILCRAQGSRGWVEEKVTSSYKGKTIAFTSNPDFLKEAIGIGEKFTMFPGRLVIEGQGFRHLMALMAEE